MKIDRRYLIRRALIFFLFLCLTIVYPALDPLFHDPDTYYITYVRDSRDLFYSLILYPSAFFWSGLFCTMLHNTSVFRNLPVGVLPDFLVFLPKLIKEAQNTHGFDHLLFLVWCIIIFHIWMLGALVTFCVQHIRADFASYQSKRREKKHRG